MHRPRSLVLTTVAAALIGGSASAVAAQEQRAADPDLQAAEVAMAGCGAAAAAGRHPEALAGAELAERAFRARLARRPDDVRALVGLARTIGQCRIPSAELMQRGELSAESVELLQRALEVEPEHWQARYILALNHYRAPSFLRRGDAAARELDHLIALQGTRNDVPEFARPFEYRGLLWLRQGQRDSAVAVWQRGLRVFPTDTALQARVGTAATSGVPATQAPPAPVAAPTPAAREDAARPAPVSDAVVPGATIGAVRVVGSRTAAGSARATPSERVVTRTEVVTAAGGMADLFQAVQLQPGATRVGEGADLFVRGGDPAETGTFINGGRVLSLARFEGLNGGLLGAIDPFVVRSARFSTGGFSARHGNALSGVLDVETDGRPRHTQWRAGVSLTQVGASARTALGASSGAWATVRGTHTGALLRTHGRTAEFQGSPHSLEGMASYIVQPRPGQELRVVGLAVRDASARIVDANGYTGPFRADGATQALVVSSQHMMTRMPVIIRGNVAVTRRVTASNFGVLSRDRTEQSAVARSDAEYLPSDAVTIRFGAEAGRLARSDVGTLPTSPAVAPGSPVRQLAQSDSSTLSGGGYAEAEGRVGVVKVLAGVRADRLPGESDVTVDPRISVSTGRGVWTARLSAGRFHQGRWRAESSIPDAGTSAGLPRQAQHLVAGLQREGAVSLLVEGFLKDYGSYGRFGSGPQVVDGVARGVDVTAQRPVGERLTGWVGYSYLDADVTLADGRTARAPYDVTHTATGSLTAKLGRGTSLGGSVRYGTGRPFTPVLGTRTLAAGRVEPTYGEPSGARVPDYARVDARLMQLLPLSGSMLTGYVELLNVLDRANVAGYVWDAAYRDRRATHTFYSQRTLVVGFELQAR